MPEKVITIGDLVSVLTGLKEGITVWNQIPDSKDATNNNDNLINPAKLEAPLSEVVKLGKLIKAHTTKIGIVYKPPMAKGNYSAAYNTTRELSSCVVLLVSVLSQIINSDKELYTEKLKFELQRKANHLYANITLLVDELLAISEANEVEEQNQESEVGGDRLISVGRVWDSSDKLVETATGGNAGSVKLDLEMTNSLIKDAKTEFEEWLEDPEIDDEDDPFGLNDKFSDDEEEDDEEVSDQEGESNKNKDMTCFVDGSMTKLKPSYIKDAENWLQKIKLVFFLISNIKSYLPLETTLESVKEKKLKSLNVKILNSIAQSSAGLPEIVDEVIDEITQGYYSQEINTRLMGDLQKISDKLIAGLKALNKGNKVKVDKVDEFYAKWSKLVNDLK